MTVLVLVLIIDTVSVPLATNTRLRSGLMVNPNGLAPTVIDDTDGVAVVVLITDTVLPPELAT